MKNQDLKGRLERLIAAAPTMLDALHEAERMLIPCGPVQIGKADCSDEGGLCAYCKTVAAIRKAEGE